ncbi:hypothetical protein KSS87_006559, partial [Heliosperma pusillum]
LYQCVIPHTCGTIGFRAWAAPTLRRESPFYKVINSLILYQCEINDKYKR